MFTRWEVMFLGLLGLVMFLALLNLARIAFGGRKPKPDEHSQNVGIG